MRQKLNRPDPADVCFIDSGTSLSRSLIWLLCSDGRYSYPPNIILLLAIHSFHVILNLFGCTYVRRKNMLLVGLNVISKELHLTRNKVAAIPGKDA